jgi:hypothetical protein
MAISKRVRFDVFKRDNFTCQYCGQKAPDVILQIEHISPRSLGGTDQRSNLLTACADCNAGKSDIPIDVMDIYSYNRAVTGFLSAIGDGVIPREELYSFAKLREWTRMWQLLDDLAEMGAMPYPGESKEDFQVRTQALGIDHPTAEMN